MSIIFSNHNGWFLSHLDFLREVYADSLNKRGDGQESEEQLKRSDSSEKDLRESYVRSFEPRVTEASSQKYMTESAKADSLSYEKKDSVGAKSRSSDREFKKYTLQGFAEMFDIRAPFLKDEQFAKLKAQATDPSLISSSKSKKRKRDPSVIDKESLQVKLLFTQFLEDMKSEKLKSLFDLPCQSNSTSIPPISTLVTSNPTCKSLPPNNFSSPTIPSVPSPYLSIANATDNNQMARKQCSRVYDLMRMYFERKESVNNNGDMIPFQGENETENVIRVEIKNPNSGIAHHFIVPPHCEFYNWDICQLYKSLPTLWMSSRFDFVLLDPPWSNKFVRRKKRQKINVSNSWYNTLDSVSQLSRIPIADMLSPSGLVGVWCTNNPTHIERLTDVVFPAWGLRPIATWYWVKVTKHQDPVHDFSRATHSKQPYERLLLAAPRSTRGTLPSACPEDNARSFESSPNARSKHKTPKPSQRLLPEHEPSSTLDISSKACPKHKTPLATSPNYCRGDKSPLETPPKACPEHESSTLDAPPNNCLEDKSPLESPPKACPEHESSTLDAPPNNCLEDKSPLEPSPRLLPEDKKIIVSVPSAVHSHKPPLTEILAPYLPRRPRCVELYARSLTPGWLSLGNQVLAFQFETLYR